MNKVDLSGNRLNGIEDGRDWLAGLEYLAVVTTFSHRIFIITNSVQLLMYTTECQRIEHDDNWVFRGEREIT